MITPCALNSSPNIIPTNIKQCVSEEFVNRRMALSAKSNEVFRLCLPNVFGVPLVVCVVMPVDNPTNIAPGLIPG
jgi:hypothetical protein